MSPGASKSRLDIRMPTFRSWDVCQNGYRIKVTHKSPRPIKAAVATVAAFFQREFQYDCLQYGYKGLEDDPYHTAYLFFDEGRRFEFFKGQGFVSPSIGACCFRTRRIKGSESSVGLQWIWIHPYFRRKGVLTKHWPFLVEQHGDFFAEPPLSPAMDGFLRKVGYPHPLP